MASTAVRATLDGSVGAAGAVAACVTLTARITQLVAGAVERASKEEPIACREGCAFCCHLRVKG